MNWLQIMCARHEFTYDIPDAFPRTAQFIQRHRYFRKLLFHMRRIVSGQLRMINGEACTHHVTEVLNMLPLQHIGFVIFHQEVTDLHVGPNAA